MSKVMKSFIYRGCLIPLNCSGRTVGVSANLELMDKFCYLDEM